MKNKKVIIIIAVVVVLGIIGSFGSSDDESPNTTESTNIETDKAEVEQDATSASQSEDISSEKTADNDNGNDGNDSGTNPETTKNEFPQVIGEDIDISFSQNVNEDVTGKWRLARVSTMKPIQDYALEYCISFFQSDDEVHAVVNFTLNTTNRLTKLTSTDLYITVYDYVDGEELSAKTLFSGTELGSYSINTSTGEITEIPTESNESDMSAAGGDTGEPASDESLNDADSIAPSEEMVWIDDTGKKYHSHSSCSNMSDPYQIPKSEAEARGRGACKKCY